MLIIPRNKLYRHFFVWLELDYIIRSEFNIFAENSQFARYFYTDSPNHRIKIDKFFDNKTVGVGFNKIKEIFMLAILSL